MKENITAAQARDHADRLVSIAVEVKRLCTAGKPGAAVDALQRYATEAIRAGQIFVAEECDVMRARILESMGRSSEAVRVLKDAHRLTKSTVTRREVAMQFVRMGRIDDAKSVLSSAGDDLDTSQRLWSIAFSGFVSLRGGDFRAAEHSLLLMLSIATDTKLAAADWDFSLVTEMVDQCVGVETCRRYLTEVIDRSDVPEFRLVHRVATNLLARLANHLT